MPPRPVYEVVAGRPSWERLSRLATEKTACMVAQAAVAAMRTWGRSSPECEKSLGALNACLNSELPAAILRDVLAVCLSRDKFRCHHNPSDCLALELWRIFYSGKFQDVSVVHHEFAFAKTSNYPDIVQNVAMLLSQVAEGASAPTSFRLELKHCEVGRYLQDKLADCVSASGVCSRLRVLEVPGLGSDELLHVLAANCANLEVLNVRGSREQVTDSGFLRYVEGSDPAARSRLLRLDVTRCMLSQGVLVGLKALTGLRELSVSTRVLDEIACCLALPAVRSVNVEHDGAVQVSVNQVMAQLRQTFPGADGVALTNCIACELHVSLTQHPANVAYMRQNVHTLDLISADYFNFPHLVYPCPNLESLHIEKPTNDLFHVDQQNVPFLRDGDTVPFVNLRVLKLSRISLTNLSQFLSKSANLRCFKVTNIGRRERPRWTDERIRQILPPRSVPGLEDFHVSCLPNEGLSTVESHRYLHLTAATVRYLVENFAHIKRVAGIETWTPKDCDRESLSLLLNSDKLSGQFSVISI